LKKAFGHTFQTPNNISRTAHLLSMYTYHEVAERPHIKNENKKQNNTKRSKLTEWTLASALITKQQKRVARKIQCQPFHIDRLIDFIR
jgi:hypothetical protein